MMIKNFLGLGSSSSASHSTADGGGASSHASGTTGKSGSKKQKLKLEKANAVIEDAFTGDADDLSPQKMHPNTA